MIEGGVSNAALAASLPDLLAAHAQASGAAFVALSSDGSLVWHNERFADMWSIPSGVLAQGSPVTLKEWLSGDGGSAAAVLARLLLATSAPACGEVALLDGRTIRWQTAPVGALTTIVWAFRDVTAGWQTAAALQDAGHLLRMLEAHADGILLEMDEDARIVGIWSTNRPFFEKPDTMLQGLNLVEALGEARGGEFDALVRRVFATGNSQAFEYALDLHGVRRAFAAKAILMAGVEHEPPRVTVMIRDVTERTRMQAQLLEAERIMSAGLLAAGVAHEVNNPLAYTLLNLERIQTGLRAFARRDPGPVIGELLEAVRMGLEGVRRVQVIVQDLRHFSRSDADAQRVPVDVRPVLDFAIDMAGPETRGRAKIVREFGEVPYVIANESRLSQVFLNLLVNAAQAIPLGTPDENEIRLVTGTDNVGRAVVEVRDTGEGIPPAVLPHIFEPFYTTKEPGSGTGLGLAICSRIASSLGGRLEVDSQVGRGSVFRLVLPAAERERFNEYRASG
jgi:two-component system, NtrC family, sensor kinase